jgi:hypothetical protein
MTDMPSQAKDRPVPPPVLGELSSVENQASLCPPDAWHSAMGYNARLAAEALYFNPEEGCVANISHSPP